MASIRTQLTEEGSAKSSSISQRVNDETYGRNDDVSRASVIVLVYVKVIIVLMHEELAVFPIFTGLLLVVLAAVPLDELRVLIAYDLTPSVARSLV